MIFRTISRSGIGLLAVALLFDLAGSPIAGATSDRQQTPTAAVKERLRVAADVSLELAPLADGPGKTLRQSHVYRYSAARPWANFGGGGSCDSSAADWPTEKDAPALRAMLAEGDPKLRALALEALATLRLPEDVPGIARLLADESPAPPYVDGSGRSVRFVVLPGMPRDPDRDPPAELYAWYPGTVGTYARRALGIVTGEFLDAKTFDKWWAINHNYHERLWYWNQRIRGAILLVKRGVREELRPTPGMNADEWNRLQKSVESLTEIRLEELRKRIAAEVMLLEPETAAKILLLATDCVNGGNHAYFERLSRIPLSVARLFELLAGQRLWPDVDWRSSAEHYNHLVDQIMLASPPVFGPEHITRLQEIFARRQGQTWSKPGGAIFVGVSRLLPAAQGNFNTATREGYLRAAIEGPSDVFDRNMAAAELVRVDLPGQWKYLKAIIFSQPRVSAYPDLVQTIIRSLGECPITAAKREALLDLVKERRIKPLLKQEDGRYRDSLEWTINDHMARQTSVFSSGPTNPLDALPGIVATLTSRAKASPPVETCR